MKKKYIKYGAGLIFPGLIGLAAYATQLQTKIEQPNMSSFSIKVIAELSNQNETATSSLAFDKTGEYLAVRSGKNTINVWQWKEKRIVITLNLPSGTNDFLSSAALAFSPDGSLLMSCHTPASDYSSVTLWDTKTWKVARKISTEKSGGCTAAAFTWDGKHIVRLTQKSRTQPGNTIEVYSTDSWKLIAGVRTFPWYVTNLALPLSGNQIAVAGRMGEVNKDFSSEMSTFQKLALPRESALAVLDLPTLHIATSYPLATVASPFGSLAWKTDGKSISYASGHGMETFNVHGSERLHYVPALVANAHESIAYTNDGRFLIEAHGSNVDELQIWDPMHSQKLQSIKGQFFKIAASQDSRHVAAATTGKIIILDFS